MNWEEFLKTAPPLTAGIIAAIYFFYRFAQYWVEKVTIPTKEAAAIAAAKVLEVELESKRAETQVKIEQAKSVAETMSVLNRESPRQTEILRSMAEVATVTKDEQKEIRKLIAAQADNDHKLLALQSEIVAAQKEAANTLKQVVVYLPQLGGKPGEDNKSPPRLGNSG